MYFAIGYVGPAISDFGHGGNKIYAVVANRPLTECFELSDGH